MRHLRNKKTHTLRPVYCPDYKPDSEISDIIRFTLMMRLAYINNNLYPMFHHLCYFNEQVSENYNIPPDVMAAARNICLLHSRHSDDIVTISNFQGFQQSKIKHPDLLDDRISAALDALPTIFNEIKLNQFILQANLSLKELHPFLKLRLLNRIEMYRNNICIDNGDVFLADSTDNSIFRMQRETESYYINRIFAAYLIQQDRIPASYRITLYIKGIFALDYKHEYMDFYKFMITPEKTGCPLLVFEDGNVIKEYKKTYKILVEKYFKEDSDILLKDDK